MSRQSETHVTGRARSRGRESRAVGALVLAAAGLALTGCASSSGSGGTSSAGMSTPAGSAPVVSASGPGAAMPSVQSYPTGSTRPDPRGMPRGVAAVNRSDPGAVAAGFVTATWTQDTRIDTGPWNALARSAGLATPQYAASLLRPLQAAPGAAWNTMAQAHGYTTVAVKATTSDDPPPVTQTSQSFTYTVTVAAVGAKIPAQQLLMFVTVTRPTATLPWQVSSSNTSQ